MRSGRDARDRVVQRLDVQPRRLAEILEAEIGMLDVPAHGEIGAIELQDQPGIDDRLVFRPHRLGDRFEIRLGAWIVIVAEEQRDEAGRSGAQKSLCRRVFLQRGFKIGDIGRDRAAIGNGDRPVAGRRLAACAARIAEDAPCQLGKFDQILIDEAVAGAAEAGQPVLDVGGIGRLAHLAVIDDIDSGGDLFADDIVDRGGNARLQRAAFRPARPLPWRTWSAPDRPGAAGCRYGW